MEKGKINWAYKIKHVITYVAILSIIAFIVFALDRIVPASWLRFGQNHLAVLCLWNFCSPFTYAEV